MLKGGELVNQSHHRHTRHTRQTPEQSAGLLLPFGSVESSHPTNKEHSLGNKSGHDEKRNLSRNKARAHGPTHH